MIKARFFAIAAVAITAPALLPATQAFASTASTSGRAVSASAPAPDGGATFWDRTLTLEGQQDLFNKGGADLGRGAAELVSSAYIGAPQAVLDAPAHVLGLPKPLEYLDER